MLGLAKKNKNKGPAKPRNDGTRLTSFADLLKDKATEETPSAQNKKKIPYDLSYPEHPVFFSTDYFLNCYNFIPLPSKDCQREPVKKGNLSGSIHCSIIPKTDIFIPNTSNETCKPNDNTGDLVREFFSYTQLENNYLMTENNPPPHPVIPGSEIRGMIRSMYEAFTSSCMSALDFEKPLSLRVSSPFQPAILKYENGSWKLYGATKYAIPQSPKSLLFAKTDDKGCKYITDHNGTPIYSYEKVFFTSRSTKNGTKIVTSVNDEQVSEGYLVIGEPFMNKHNEFIFAINSNLLLSSDQEVIVNAIERYNSIIRDFYRDSKINKTALAVRNPSDFYAGREIDLNPQNDSVIPVWYHKTKDKSNNTYTYLSPACIGREIFINDFLKFTHTYEPCSGEEICPCCRLFGMIGKNFSLGSRLRFSDALFTGHIPLYSPITTLKELSGPKPTSMEVYTHIKDTTQITGYGGFWDYDIYTPDANTILPASEYIQINGRKMYYHHPYCSNSKYYAYTPENLISRNRKRLVTVRPLKGTEENKFEFDIFFEHITENELKMLLIVTSLLFNDSDYCYKIGMGKPIGLGSIKIKVEEVRIRSIELSEKNITYRYELTKDYDAYYKYDSSSKQSSESAVRDFLKQEKVIQSVFREIQKMTYFYYTDKDHRPKYPTPRDSDLIFQWFSNNRKLGINRGFEQTLDSSGILKKNQKDRY